MKWIKDGSLPKTEGEFYCKLRHKNDLPEDKSTGDIVEFFLGTRGWQIGEGWKVIEWLDESPSGADSSVLVAALEKIIEGATPLNQREYISWIETARQLASEALIQYNAATPQTPIDREPEAQSIIDKCETAVEVLRTMLNKLKMPLGVEAADNILTQIKGYKVMNPKEDTGPYSMPMPAQEPFPQTPRTPISQPGELDTVGEHPSDKEGEGKDLGECQDCQKRPATKDYNGHGYFVCDPCYKSLSNEFDEEYK